MARWSCAACGATTEDLVGLCTGCLELRPAQAGWPSGRILVLLYPANTQAVAAAAYRAHAELLQAAGYAPVTTSWGQDPPGAGVAFFMGNLEEAYRVGTLLVTYRREGPP
jgi:hypothetical protein